MRLFIGLELPKPMRQELVLATNALRLLSPNAAFVPAANFHITLHFIGESNDLYGAASAMAEAARDIRPFVLALDEYGAFRRGGSRIGFIGLKGGLAELSILRESLEAALYERGFSREEKRFTPHITLARSLPLAESEAEAEAIAALRLNTSMTAQAITLFESRRENGRLCYAPLHRERF